MVPESRGRFTEHSNLCSLTHHWGQRRSGVAQFLVVRHLRYHMAHIDIRHIPFALSMLPFFAIGIAFPVTMQDWIHGRLMPEDARDFFIGLLIVGVWECVIVASIRSKEQQGQQRLLGRELSSWSWAPPITFAVGVVSGLIFICT